MRISVFSLISCRFNKHTIRHINSVLPVNHAFYFNTDLGNFHIEQRR